MKHDPYSLTELIRNDDFITWIRNPDANSNARWKQFLEEYPEKKDVVEAAKGYVILLAEDTGKNKPSIEQTNKMWRVVESHIHEENVENIIPEKTISGWRWVRIAASIALILGIASISYWYLSKQQGADKELGIDNTNSIKSADIIEKVNNTKKPMTVLLADGSSVVLQPGARLSFSKEINSKRREVMLTGNAFFEIVKNPEKPFFVYTDEIATKVLGTSFLIDAPENSVEIKVEVKTGKVSVFPLSKNPSLKEREEADKPELKGIILNHNERIAVLRLNGKPVKLPEVSTEPVNVFDISKQLFVFDETPASEVFKALESAYNVKIQYDLQLKNCPLNATLIGQPFMEKLTIICAALDAQFEIKGNNQVIITGRGCR